MSFIETPRFPDDLSYGAVGGPTYYTDVVVTEGGQEYRNAIWSQARARYNVAHAARTQTQYNTLLTYFRAVRGRAHGFRFKDWTDYQCTTAAGILGSGFGTRLTPTFQLRKNYTTGSLTEVRDIKKPVSGTISIYRNASPVTYGIAAGNYGIDTTTGVVTFVPDGTGAILTVTVGSTTTLTLDQVVTSAATGKYLYVTGAGGTAGAYLNNQAWQIASVGGGGTSIVINATTTAMTTTSNAGHVYLYPQTTDTLTWSGEFDIPVRFDVDSLDAEIISRSGSSLVIGWSDIPLIEVRT